MDGIIFIIVLIITLSLGDVQSSESHLPSGLVKQKKIRDCGVIYGYTNDAGCFMEHSTNGEMIRPCSSGLYDPSTCKCTKPIPDDFKFNPECQKAQRLGVFVLYSSLGHTYNSNDTQRLSSSHTGKHHHSYRSASCYDSDNYNRLLRMRYYGMGCKTVDEVIEDLYQVTRYDSRHYTTCTNTLMTTLLSTTISISDICSCDTLHYFFRWPSLDYDTGRQCLSEYRSYYTLLSKFYSSYSYYHSHFDHHYSHYSHYSQRRTCLQLSEALTLLADIKKQSCVTDAIRLLQTTFHNISSSNVCQCRFQSSVYTCNKTQTVKALSTHSAIDARSHTHLCPDRSHYKSEAVPITLCGAPETSRWYKGQSVFTYCKRLPKFIAVASFVGDVYPGDGKAGVLISCNSTAITIVTQQCDGGLKLEHIKKGSNVHFTDMPEIYYTINTRVAGSTLFG